MDITFGPEVCGSLDAGSSREWLVSDGLGGYAMGTVAGLRTRRYHALLVVAGAHPGARTVGLAALDPVLELASGTLVRLGTHEWTSGSIAPEGHTYLERFDLVDGLPRWRYRVGSVVIEKQIAMAYGRPSVAVVLTQLSGEPCRLRAEALCTWRDAHGERHADGPMPMENVAGGAVIDGGYRLQGPGWEPAGEWYAGAHLREEAARGLGADEDLWHAGTFAADLAPGRSLEVSAWAGDLSRVPPPATEVVESAHRRARDLVQAAKPVDDVDAALVRAADAFVVSRGGRPDVVAGYPWFGCWSRDTMTSYEGLFLETNRVEEGRALLTGYAGTVNQGMLANTLDAGEDTAYNTVDGTLWFLHAIGRHVEATGDRDLVAELMPTMRAIVDGYTAGTRYNIHVDPSDSLVSAGADGFALTWMDARTAGHVVTPRIGKPVEVNALWVAGLATVARLGASVGASVHDVAARHDAARTSFRHRYPTGDGLYDVLDGPSGNDATIRPNQLLAWSLPDGPMDGPPPALDTLLTPLGLRSLDPGDPAYMGRHRGDQTARDLAYHQGTVWPWLIGPYVTARHRADLPVEGLTEGLAAHLADYGVGSVSETADGDAPHGATGCPFQAWSVAELLRARRLI